MDNRDVARLLVQTADLMEIAAEDPFRIRSYRNAATAIEACPESVLDILRDPNRKVTDLPGIGKGMAAHRSRSAQSVPSDGWAPHTGPQNATRPVWRIARESTKPERSGRLA